MSILTSDEAPIRQPVVDPKRGFILTREWEQWIQRSKRTYWEDLRFPAEGINPAGGGANAPTVVTADPFAGTLLFSASATNLIVGVAQIPHSWKVETELVAHVHWCPTNTNTGNVAWRFSYQIGEIGSAFPASLTTAGIELDAGSGTTNQHQYHEFTPIDMTGVRTLSCMLIWKVERVGGDASDTYTGTARFLEFDIHYQIDLPGSRSEDNK